MSMVGHEMSPDRNLRRRASVGLTIGVAYLIAAWVSGNPVLGPRDVRDHAAVHRWDGARRATERDGEGTARRSGRADHLDRLKPPHSPAASC